jgi:hypothetical protein
MARIMVLAIVLAFRSSISLAEDAVPLREEPTAVTTRVLIELKADGEFPVDAVAGAAKEKPLPLKIEARLDFYERVIKRDEDGSPRRAARRAVEAAAAIGDARGIVKLRPEVALLTADRRAGGVVVVSPSGPLMRSELDLVQVPGDPLAMGGLLPAKAVKVGDRWPISDEAAKNLCDYDALTKNGLEAKLESLDDAKAEVRVGGEVRGSARGGEGVIVFAGRFTFDRKLKRISRLNITRDEARKAGPVEAALNAKSTLTVERDPADTPAALSDEVLATLPRDDDPRREWLLLSPPDARYTLEHDRDWHLKREDPKGVVLTRLDKDKPEPLAHLHLSVGPNAGKGRHQDLAGFRDDVKKAIGTRFDEIVGAGEVEAGPNAGFQYKMAVVGHEGERPVLWYYYLLAGPEGDQLLGIFTLAPESEKRFNGEDRAVLGSLEWKAAK